MWWTNPLCNSAEDLGTLAENEPPTDYEPNEYHITEAYVDYTQESTGEQRSPNVVDYDDVTIGKALLNACRRRTDHFEEGLSSCLSSSVSHDRTGRPVVCSLVTSAKETQRHTSESEQINTLLERQREQILADCQAEIRKHEFQAGYDRKSIQKMSDMIESQEEEICLAHQGDERLRQDHQLLHEQLLEQNWYLRVAHDKSLSEMEELKRFQGSTFDTIARKNWSKIETLSLKYKNYRTKSNCMNDSRDFQDAESVRSGQSHVDSNQCSSHIIQILVECRAAEKGRQAFGTHMVFRDTFFANPTASSSAPYPQELNPWSSNISEHTHSSHVEKSENHTPVQDQRCQSRPSARNSVNPSEGDFFKELWSRPTTTADLISSFRQFLHASNVRLLEDNVLVHNFLRKLCIG